MHVLRPEQHAEWMAALERTHRYDFYHLPEYHALAERLGEGEARLFVHQEGDYLIALPLLLRPLEAVAGLGAPPGWKDATSVYGYPGPLASHPEVPEPVVRGFHAALAQALREEQVVAVFSRLHPLLAQSPLLAGLGVCRHTGRTVAIDLLQPPEAQRARYRKNHKYDINRLKRLGVSCAYDLGFDHLDTFVDIYHETMRRVGAADNYFFPPSYFRQLVAGGASHVHLFVCHLEGRVICGGLFLECNGIVQYHLGGTRSEALRLAPSKLLFDIARLWAHGQGERVLHLGGGTTASPEDSLFHFKTGFSDLTYEFLTWRWVLQPTAYERLVERGGHWNAQHGRRPAVAGYFPEYRTPTVPARSEVL